MSLALSLSPKFFAAAFSGIVKREFHGDDSMTDEFLIGELFSGVAPEAAQSFLATLADALACAAKDSWQPSTLADRLAENGAPSENVEAALNVYKTESKKVLSDFE
jgi:hypothetical protein